MNNIKSSFFLPSQIVSGEIEDFDDIKDELINLIYDYKNEYPNSEVRSNRGGWQSSGTGFFHEMFSKQIEVIKNNLSKLIREYNFVVGLDIPSMWININPKYSYNNRHTHPGANISGVFWVKIPENSGDFVFEMPDNFDCFLLSKTNHEHKQNNNLYSALSIKPKEGSIILFPSYLPHYVEQNQSGEDRISISFNLILQ